MAATVDLMEVTQAWVTLLGPATRRPPDLARERREADWDRHLRQHRCRGESCSVRPVAFPVRPGGGRAGAGQPVQRYVVEDMVPRQIARGPPINEGARDLLVGIGVMVDHPGGQGDRRV